MQTKTKNIYQIMTILFTQSQVTIVHTFHLKNTNRIRTYYNNFKTKLKSGQQVNIRNSKVLLFKNQK